MDWRMWPSRASYDRVTPPQRGGGEILGDWAGGVTQGKRADGWGEGNIQDQTLWLVVVFITFTLSLLYSIDYRSGALDAPSQYEE